MRHLFWLPCLLLLHACDQASEPTATQGPAPTIEPAWTQPEQTLNTFLQKQSQERLRRLSVSANGFADAINGLLNDTTAERLTTARQAWSHLYQSFNESFVVLMCRATQNPADIARIQRADSFPILPGYIDGLNEWPDSGIVNDISLALTREALLAQQGATLEGEISIGFQVLHFLLNGDPAQARTEDALKAITQLNDEDTGALENQPANRRRLYLQLATGLIVEDLSLLVREEGMPQNISRDCPTGPLRETVARLIRLDGLQDSNQVSQDYMADNVRSTANNGLQSSLTPWLAKSSPLYPWLEARAIGQNSHVKPPPALNSKDRIVQLQALHAALASVQQKLRQAYSAQ